MIAGAMATWQAWMLIGLAVAAAIGLFLLKLRPPQITVPSLTLWQRVLDDSRERSFWERIRRAVSLIVAVLVTLAIALTIIRPQPRSAAASTSASAGGTQAAGGRVAIVLDSSWSMLAQTSSGPTRWDRAVARARALAAGAGGEEVVLSTTADGLVEGPTPDVSLIDAALDRISPSGGEGTPWPAIADARATYFLTDGAVPRALDPGVTVESFFEPAPNVAITAFDVRQASMPDLAGQAFLDVANYSETPQDVRITLTRGGDSVLDIHTDLAAGAAVQRVVPLARGGDPRLRARISAKNNALVVDDEAVALIPDGQPLAVAVVSPEPANLLTFLSRDPIVKATAVSPAAYKPGAESLVIFDRVLPAIAPTTPALFIAPPASPWLGTPSGEEHEPQWAPAGGHPLLQGVDLLTMPLEAARSYAGANLEAVAVSRRGTPLILVADTPDRRLAVFTFGIGESKLMFDPGFPVLMHNAIDWLSDPAPSHARRPGPVVLGGSLSSIIGPNNQPVPVTKVGGRSLATLSRVGFYDVHAGGATSVIAVNAGDPETSDLRRTRLADAARPGASSSPARGRPWWLYAAAFAFILLAAEWWTWQRRVTV